MSLADEVAEASGAIGVLRAIASECRAQRRELEVALYSAPASPRADLHRRCTETLDDAAEIGSSDWNGDAAASRAAREQLVGLVVDAGLGVSGWWTLGCALDAHPDLRPNRARLVRSYLTEVGRSVADGQFLLEPGDPVASSVHHRFRVPASDRVDRFPGTWFVPQSADGHSVILDYRLGGAVDSVVRPTISPRAARPDVATVHPFAALDYREGSGTTERGWGYPFLPVSDPNVRRDRLVRGIATAIGTGARLIILPELVGSRADVEHVATTWLDRNDTPGLLLAGSFHEHAGRANVAIVAGRDSLGQLPAMAEFLKNTPQGGVPAANGDRDSDRARARREDIPLATEPTLRILAGNAGSMSVLICRDALDASLVAVLCDLAVDLVLCPALSPRLEAFEAAATYAVVHGAGRFVLANGLGFSSPVAMIAPRVGPIAPGAGQLVATVRATSPGVASWSNNSNESPDWLGL